MYIKTENTSPKTISNRIDVLHQIFFSALHDEIITKDPVEFIKKPKIPSVQINPFDKDEALSIIQWMERNQPRMAAFFAIGFYTGMRIGEVLALKWSDVDFAKNIIVVRRTITKNRIKESTKTSESRVIDIIPVLDKYIKNHKQFTFMKSDWVFTTVYGEPYMQTENISRLYFEPCLKALKLHHRTLYQMRHSFACMMIDAGENLNWIKSMLGHRTLEMILKRYGNRINRRDGTRKGVIFSDNVPNVCQKESQSFK